MAMNYWTESSPAGGSQRSGDFAKCFDIAPHRRAIVVGDIAGHGDAAGHGAAVLWAYVYYLVGRGIPPDKALRAASEFFIGSVMNDGIPFASLFIAVADLREGRIQYASAGHEPALLFSGDGVHEHLEPTGPVLGPVAEPEFVQHTLPLFRDSLLVVATDGITEARRDAADSLSFFGTSGVVRALCDAVREQRDPAREIYGAAVRHAGGAFSDDASVVVSSLPFPHRVRMQPSLHRHRPDESLLAMTGAALLS
jgi:sigma-B regulation protein RsbU (phosphoserine phosphatase)